MSCPDCPPPSRRRRRVLAAAIGLALLAVLAAELRGAPGGRRGRVERVERPRFAAAAAVRICAMIGNPQSGREDRVTCYGGAPAEPGTSYQVVDDQGLRGSGVAERSEPAQMDSCRLGSMHDVLLTFDAGLRANQGRGTSLGVQGVELSPRARQITDSPMTSPSGRDGEQVWATIDRDGDAQVDLAATWFDCTGQVRDVPRPPAGMQTVSSYCMEYWLKGALEWRKVNREIYFGCN